MQFVLQDRIERRVGFALWDLVVRDALIVDGTGSAPRAGDIAVRGDRIVRVGTVRGAARREVRAEGSVITPGFIDVHTHDDRLILDQRAVLPKVSQGVTTVVTGNCGISLAPLAGMEAGQAVPAPLTLLGDRSHFPYETFASYLADIAASPPAVNVVPLVGHTSLRASTMSDLNREASAAELDSMASLLGGALQAGACGMSTGLYYPPASAAPAREVETLLRHVVDHDGIYTTHLRDEGDNLIAAIEEALSSARKTGASTVISHLKCASPRVWGQSAAILGLLDRAMAEGLDVAFDIYPYDASSTMLRPDRLAGARRIVVSWSTPYPDAAGKDLDVVAACLCCSPQEAARRLSPGGGIYYKMQERDVRRILCHPLGMIGSDGLPHDQHPHPRLWGTFPRVLGHYVRELKLFPLAEAVRKMTSLSAQVFGLKDRGTIQEGAYADIVLFDQNTIIDDATYDIPTVPSRGIRLVLVNGEPVWADQAATGRYPGRVLKRVPSGRGRAIASPALAVSDSI